MKEASIYGWSGTVKSWKAIQSARRDTAEKKTNRNLEEYEKKGVISIQDNLHPIFSNIFKTTFPDGVFMTPTKEETEEWTPSEKEEAYDKFCDEEENRATDN